MSSSSFTTQLDEGGGKRRKIGDIADELEAYHAEGTSLSLISDDGLSSMLRYLDPPALGRCEATCKSLKHLADGAWTSLSETDIFRQSVSGFGSKVDAGGIRLKVIKWYLASRYAERIEPMIARHLTIFAKKDDRCKGCTAFPSQLFTDIYSNPDEYELFARISIKSAGGELLSRPFQGFVPCRNRGERDKSILVVDFNDVNLSEWPMMEMLLTLKGGSWDLTRATVDPIVKNLETTFLAVPKLGNPYASLVQGSCGLSLHDNMSHGIMRFEVYHNSRRGMNNETHIEKTPTKSDQSWMDLIWDGRNNSKRIYFWLRRGV